MCLIEDPFAHFMLPERFYLNGFFIQQVWLKSDMGMTTDIEHLNFT